MKKGESFMASNIGWLVLALLATIIILYLVFKGKNMLSSFLSFIK